jgi:nitrogen fixation NifU-like protein
VLGQPVGEALDQAEAFRRLMHGEGEADEELLGDGIAFKGVARYPVRVKCALLGWMAFKDAATRAGTAGGPGAHGAEGDSPGWTRKGTE